jgi:hypothetical protein
MPALSKYDSIWSRLTRFPRTLMNRFFRPTDKIGI